MGRFLEIMTKSTYQESHACLNSCQWHQWEPHWLWKGQVCNWIFLASFHGEWMSVSQSKATLFKYSRPHEEVSKEYNHWLEARPWRIIRPPIGMSCSRVRSMKPCCMVYPTRASSSPCFLFFRPLIAASSGVRVYGGDMICSSLPIWSYIARISSFSPGNTNGGPGLHDCQMRSCATFQACQATVSSSVRKASFKSSPGRLDLFVKSLSLRSAGEYQPGPLATNWLCNSRHCGSRSPHMVLTSYFLLKSWKS